MQSIAGSGKPRERSDEHLLHDYVAGQDTAAFEAIVRRHGAMVLGVCRRVLHHEQDAEDAFQATFLVLLHKARSLTRPELLSNWLYGVAFRTALKARQDAMRRRQREGPMVHEPIVDSSNDAVWNDLRPILDDEVQRLPHKYRTPVVLCYLEGQSTQEAARTLGCPKGTVLSRLARARQQLKSRFTRRGLAVSTGVLATLLARAASAEGSVPIALLQASVPSQGVGTPDPAIQRQSANVVDLSQHVLKSMSMRKLQTAAALMVAIFGICALVCVLVLEYRAFSTRWVSDDAEKLQGTWEVVAVERDGLELPEQEFAYIQMTIRGKAITARTRTGDQEITFRLDPMSRPKSIDISITNQTYYGIYALAGNTLKLCWPENAGRERPTEFVCQRRSGTILITCKRATMRPMGPGSPPAAHTATPRQVRLGLSCEGD
jgi:RNA polymerase sigma factor (sigma-70 family)